MTSPDPRPFVGPVYRPQALPQCTNWEAYDVYAIWAMVEREDGRELWKQARAWALMGQLCEHQAQRLRTAAKDLAEFWPPERSPAAQIFLTVIDSMAASLDESARAATNTGLALEDLTDSLLATRARIADLVQERNTREQEYEQREREELPWMRGHDALIGGQRRDIDQRAQQVMREADVVLAETRTAMPIPAEFSLSSHSPITPIDPAKPSSVSASTANESSLLAYAGVPASAGYAARPADLPDRRNTINSAAEFGPGGPSIPVLAGSPGNSSVLPPAAHTVLPIDGAAPSTAASGQSPGTVGVGRVIGAGKAPSVAQPATGSARASTAPTTGTAGGPPRAINPTVLPPMMAPPAARGAGSPVGTGGRAAGSHRRRLDPEDPWAVKVGIPAVLEPIPEGSHDPGPGVIGIDR